MGRRCSSRCARFLRGSGHSRRPSDSRWRTRRILILHGSGDFAVITGALSAANPERVDPLHPPADGGKISGSCARLRFGRADDDRDKAFAEAQTLLKVYPNMRLIVAIAAPAVPGAAEAVKQSGRTDVKVTGVSLPNLCKPYVHAGVVPSVVLWDTHKLGYLVVEAAEQSVNGDLRKGATSMEAGKLGRIRVDGDQVILGEPLVFTKENIDQIQLLNTAPTMSGTARHDR